MNRTRKRAVMRSLLLGMLGVGAIGVVQTSIASTAGAESVDVGTIVARMSNQHGVTSSGDPDGTDESNCVLYSPAGTATSSLFVASPLEATTSHGKQSTDCPTAVDLGQQSALTVRPVGGDLEANGVPFLLAEFEHHNERVEGSGASYYDGATDIAFPDFDGDPSMTVSWRMQETQNRGQGGCCTDTVVFTLPDSSTDMVRGDMAYRMSLVEVVPAGGEACPATLEPVMVASDDHEEGEPNTLETREDNSSRGCLYGSLAIARPVTIVKAIEGSESEVTAPSHSFVIDSTSSSMESPWNTSFTLTPPDDGSEAADAVALVEGEAVTLVEQDPMNPRWELTDIECTDVDAEGDPRPLPSGASYDVESRTLVLARVPAPDNADDPSITCTFTNTYTPKTTLTLVKVVADGEAEVDDFTLSATGIADTPTEGEVVTGVSGTSATTQVLLPAGDYVLAEDGPTGYLAPDGWDCGDAEMDGATVTLADEADVTCTIVNEIEREEITLTKDPSRDFFSAAGQVITYSYTITNTGNQPLGPGQFEVTDDMIDAGVAFDCGADDVALDPDETVTCTRDYTSTAADVTAGEIVNEAFASLGDLDSENVTATVEYAVLLIAKSPSPTQVSAAGQTVTYTYTLTNNGTDPLGPDQFTVTDDRIDSGTAFNCGAAASTIAVAGTLSCTSTYTVTAADITAGSIVNTASAAGAGVVSPTVSVTVTVVTVSPIVVPPIVTTPVLPAATPSLNLTKTASPDVFFAVGDVITYTYTILNDGDTAIGPTQFTITDNKINGGVPFKCGPATKVISVDLSQVCTAYYTITAADMAAGSVTNTAFASGGTVDSNTATATVNLVSLIFPAEIPVTGAMSTTVLGFGFVTFGLGLGFVLLVRRRRLL